MKYSIATLLFILLSFSSIGLNQNSSSNDFPTLWKTCKEKKLNGHNILREVGSGYSTPYIMYKTQNQLIEDAKQKAKIQMWTSDSLTKHNAMLESYKGGEIAIKIVGENINAANTKNFTVIIQDVEGVELYRKTLAESIPDGFVNGVSTLWVNYGYLYLENPMNFPIRVFIINSYYPEEKYSKTVYLIKD